MVKNLSKKLSSRNGFGIADYIEITSQMFFSRQLHFVSAVFVEFFNFGNVIHKTGDSPLAEKFHHHDLKHFFWFISD